MREWGGDVSVVGIAPVEGLDVGVIASMAPAGKNRTIIWIISTGGGGINSDPVTRKMSKLLRECVLLLIGFWHGQMHSLIPAKLFGIKVVLWFVEDFVTASW